MSLHHPRRPSTVVTGGASTYAFTVAVGKDGTDNFTLGEAVCVTKDGTDEYTVVTAIDGATGAITVSPALPFVCAGGDVVKHCVTWYPGSDAPPRPLDDAELGELLARLAEARAKEAP